MVMENYKITNTPNSTVITYGKETKLSLFEICPGVMLSFNEVHSKYLPTMDSFLNECLLTINYSLSGICEAFSVNHHYIYVKGGDLVISNESASQSFHYPVGHYTGIELYLFEDAYTKGISTLEQYDIDIQTIIENYLNHGSTFVTDSIDSLRIPLDFLMNLYKSGTPDISLLRLNALLILRLLTSGLPTLYPKSIRALTPGQMKNAKDAEAILTKDLSYRIPIREISDSMGISETSLKNYFYAVFGKTVSIYLLELRIEKAKELLKDQKLSILEIAHSVGYENQSKFTYMFHKNVGITPRDYRKQLLFYYT